MFNEKNLPLTVNVIIHIFSTKFRLRTISIIFRRIEGLWHTAIVVYGNEYFFGGHGIACCVPGTTQLGPPLKQELLGMTAVTQVSYYQFLNTVADMVLLLIDQNIFNLICMDNITYL